MPRRLLLLGFLLPFLGCEYTPPGMNPRGDGPGRRAQTLALSPAQELRLGREAFDEVKTEYRGRIVEKPHPAALKVEEIGKRIEKAARIEPLRREINLHIDDRFLEWEFVLLKDDRANAFCLPGGKVAVFSGLIPVAEEKAGQVATVVAHEIAHALAHHSSERLARRQARKDEGQGVLGPLQELHYERQQESEADHIGVFLMTFADYDPRDAVRFWENMHKHSGGGNLPEIFSDHPSDARRIEQICRWCDHALAAKAAWKAGHVAKD